MCGLADRSERGKLAISGPEAKPALNGLVTNELEQLTPGDGLYAAVLTAKGKMLGDLRILDSGDELLLDMERAALQPVFDVLRHGLVGFGAELHKRTLQRGLLSLIGPAARAVAGVPELPVREHASAASVIAGAPVRVITTDLGADVLCDAADTPAVVAELTARGAVPMSDQAAELARIESGRPRYGVDLDDSVIPQEAGLNERAVSFTKGCYVGQETVARLFYRGKPNRHLRGLVLSEPVKTGSSLLLGEREVGRITSFAVSPRLGPIGLAIVRREAEPGVELAVGGCTATALLVELPF